MESPLFDFRAALSGEEPAPTDTEEDTSLLQEQGTNASRSESAPVSVDLTSGLLLLRHGGSSVEVDTTTQNAVLDPGGSEVTVDDDGVMLFGARGDQEGAAPLLFNGQETEHVVSVSAPEAGDPSDGEGQRFEALLPMEQGVPAEPLTPFVDASAGEASVPASEATLFEAVPAEPAEPAEPAVVMEPLQPVAPPLEAEGEEPGGSERTESGEPVTGVELISADADDPARVEPAPEIDGSPVVTLDPDTGVTTVEAGGLRFVLDPDTGTIEIEPGDRDVPLDSETAPVTVETGHLSLTFDPAEGTVGIETADRDGGGEGTETPPTTIEVGDLRLTLDPETGEVSLDPGDGEVEVDPETGLITVSEDGGGKEGGEGGDGPGREDASDDPGRGDHDGGSDEPRGEEAPGDSTPGQDDRSGGSDAADEEVPGGDGTDGGQHFQDVVNRNPESSLSHLPPTTSTVPAEEQTAPREEAARLEPRQVVEPSAVVTPETPGESGGSGGGDTNGEQPPPDDVGQGPQDSLSHLVPPDEEPVPREPRQLIEPSVAVASETPEEDEEGTGGGETSGGDGDRGEEEEEGGEETDDEETDGEETDGENGDQDGEEETEGGGDDEKTEDEDKDESKDEGAGGGGNGGGESGAGGGGEGTKIDLDRIQQFRTNIVTPLRKEIDAHVTAFSVFGGTGEGRTAGYNRLGDRDIVPMAGTLVDKIDTSMGNIYQFLSDLQQELTDIEERLSESLIEFVEVENEQNITAQELSTLLGGGVGSTSGSNSSVGGEETTSET
ncbi:hypothetical protein [Nocardiopsis halotolerans]|uniref:hypothetical protein n=1 Tax=Nocardiopsis halotolerans TaxID=124252 RepID=UPI00034800C6|nr:hypothetical protein [Nocardiopsis halotolerans]